MAEPAAQGWLLSSPAYSKCIGAHRGPKELLSSGRPIFDSEGAWFRLCLTSHDCKKSSALSSLSFLICKSKR